MHPWIGAGEEDRRRLLEDLGLRSIDELFVSIPDEVCIDKLELPPALDEESIRQRIAGMAIENLSPACVPSFLGAGVYRHVQPSVVDAVLRRAEFFTSYTPYQAEISQGTLQVIFEFQTLISRLTEMEVANASLYDGATGLVEAVLFSHRVQRGRRNSVIIAETVHPMYRQVLDTYAQAGGFTVATIPCAADGRVDPQALHQALNDDTCCVAIQSPNFLGIIEELPQLSEVIHSSGALAIEVVTEAVSLGLLHGGGAFGFDVVCGEAQSFGIAPGFGGPHLGFFACTEKNVRQMPGRLAGRTVDEEGNRAYCLTLSTREQHIRRAKATSNICTNQGLIALAATVWLEVIGGTGLRRLARSCLARAEHLKRRIRDLGGSWHLTFPDSPTFNEFLLTGPKPGAQLVDQLADDGVLAGVAARRWGGSWPDGILVATTELTSATDIEAMIAALGRIS